MVSLYYYLFNIIFSVFHAGRVIPDQIPRSAASDLGLYCLTMSPL